MANPMKFAVNPMSRPVPLAQGIGSLFSPSKEEVDAWREKNAKATLAIREALARQSTTTPKIRADRG